MLEMMENSQEKQEQLRWFLKMQDNMGTESLEIMDGLQRIIHMIILKSLFLYLLNMVAQVVQQEDLLLKKLLDITKQTI